MTMGRFDVSRAMAIAVLVLACLLVAARTAVARQNQPPPKNEAPAAVDKDYPMGKEGSIRISVPAGWKDDSILATIGDAAASLLDFTSRDNSGPIRVQVVSFPPARLDPKLAADEGLKTVCRAYAAQYIGKAKAKELKLDAFDGTEVHGFSYAVADESNSGPYRLVTGGALKLGQLFIVFTIYHQEKQLLVEPAKQMVRDAKIVGKEAAATTKPAMPVSLPSPDGTWNLRVPALMISPSLFYRREDGDTLRYGTRDRSFGVGIEAYFEPAPKRGGATIVRSYYHTRLKQSRATLEKVKLEGNDSRAILRYRVNGMQCVGVYMVHQKTWVSANFTCDADDKDALALLEKAVDSVTIAGN